jgi:DNA-binding MarR family transcriptional regulator
MDNNEYRNLILNMVNFYMLFNSEFSELIPDLSNTEISPLLSKILNLVHEEGITTASILSRKLNVSIPNISRSINTLNALEYIIKKQDSSDKRIIYLSLSPKALAHISKVSSSSDEKFLKRFNVLSLEEVQELSQSFSTIQDLIIKMRTLNKGAVLK